MYIHIFGKDSTIKYGITMTDARNERSLSFDTLKPFKPMYHQSIDDSDDNIGLKASMCQLLRLSSFLVPTVLIPYSRNRGAARKQAIPPLYLALVG